ncbi:acyltransferase family protein [Pantoea agglomerans]|uniref:acyltransferase family protein n=1 Tax=Enterobacter agglomerans TaxID=549 RepID=UPI001CBF4781|nr:acyltransferase [Pantoea agglomerans]
MLDKEINKDIEVLRAIAIVTVMLAHIPLILLPDSFYFKILNISKFGSGVDLFFCVSGFIVTRSLINKDFHKMNRSDFLLQSKMFYIKRAFRLLPAAFFWIAISIALTIAVNNYQAFLPLPEMLKSAFFAITQTSNFYFISCRPAGNCGNLGVYWSLSLENQFYLLLPIFLFMFKNRKLCIVMAIIIVAQFFIPRTLNSNTPMGWPLRTDAIALGVIIAVLSTKETYQRFNPKFMSHKVLALAVLLALTFLLCIFTDPNPIVSFQVGVVALLSGVMVFIASYNRSYFLFSEKFEKVCLYVGSRSYSIYLTHFIALSITKYVFILDDSVIIKDLSFLKFPFFIILTIAMSEFSFRFVENKFRYAWKKIPKVTAKAP